MSKNFSEESLIRLSKDLECRKYGPEEYIFRSE